MKILIIGASGLLGSHLKRVAEIRGHDVVGTFRGNKAPGLTHLDAGDSSAILGILENFTPDVVLYSAGYSWVDGCEANPLTAYKENKEIPEHIALLSKPICKRFVYVSTSYVFDGKQSSYDEQDEPSPISVYGRSKYLAEQSIRDVCMQQALILRTMGVYGEEPQRKNFLYQVVDRLRAGQPMMVPSDQYGNITYAGDFAGACLRLLELGESGIWNIAGPDPSIRRSDFAHALCKAYHLDESLIRSLPTSQIAQKAARPVHGGLNIGKVVSRLEWTPRPWVHIPL